MKRLSILLALSLGILFGAMSGIQGEDLLVTRSENLQQRDAELKSNQAEHILSNLRNSSGTLNVASSTLRFPVYNLTDFNIYQTASVSFSDTGLECPAFPPFLEQYDPHRIAIENEYMPREVVQAVKFQVKQVLVWVNLNYYEGRCGEAYAAGTAWIVEKIASAGVTLWISVDHVGYPKRYTSDFASVNRITIEDKEAIILYGDQHRILLATPNLVDFTRDILPPYYSPEPDDNDFQNVFKLGTPLYMLGRTFTPICSTECIDSGMLRMDAIQEIVTHVPCHIINDQSTTVNAPNQINYLGGDIWGNCEIMGGNSGGPLAVKIDDQWHLTGTHNVGASNGVSGTFALPESFGAVVQEYVERIEAGWNPFLNRPSENNTQANAPRFLNWDDMSLQEQSLWLTAFENNERFYWTLGNGSKYSNFDAETISSGIKITPEYLEDLRAGHVGIYGNLQNWEPYLYRWEVGEIRER